MYDGPLLSRQLDGPSGMSDGNVLADRKCNFGVDVSHVPAGLLLPYDVNTHGMPRRVLFGHVQCDSFVDMSDLPDRQLLPNKLFNTDRVSGWLVSTGCQSNRRIGVPGMSGWLLLSDQLLGTDGLPGGLLFADRQRDHGGYV